MTPILFPVIVLVLVVALAAMVTGIFNKLVTDRKCYKNGFAQIEVQIKRRYDLIPKHVETAKGYMRHKRETLHTRSAINALASLAAVSWVGSPAARFPPVHPPPRRR